jgi:hypothetical protein
MTLHTVRATLYRIVRALGDVQAVEHGTVPKRLVRRVVGKVTGRILGKLFR